MLTGRESLKRLIGKRRRFFPNHLSLISTPIQSPSNFLKDKSGAISSGNDTSESSSGRGAGACENSAAEESAVEASTSDGVTCPVCGNTVRGGELMINCHLDACLTRGTKRKLTQRTLLQLNFCSRSKDKVHCDEWDPVGLNVDQDGSKNNITENIFRTLTGSDAVQEHTYDLQGSCIELNGQSHLFSSAEDSSNNCDEFKVDMPLSPCVNEMPMVDKVLTTGSASEVVLQTFIVGRKFSDEEKVSLGAKISLQRDPNNVKDPNAIKVLSVDSVDSGCFKRLGFLPRELARYLSPLIHKYGLCLEGYVTSIPKDSLDVVPIQICCHNASSFEENFESLWKNVLHVVESMRIDPPSTTKYLQNFSLLIEECLRNCSHLLTDAERVFLESFKEQSVDSQRLFVRLYIRKGPWFQISKISYPEILDSQAAAKELLANGFVSPFKSTSESFYDDMESVLNLLTVSELREISCISKKSCSRGTRKRDLIISIISSYQSGSSSSLQSMVLEKAEACIRISTTAESLIWRAQRLFFLNGEQDLSAFLLVDLGLIKYPTYNCIVTKQMFATRSDLLAFEEAIEVAQIMDESLDRDNNEVALRCIEISDSCLSNSSGNTCLSPATFFSCFSASWVYSKVVLLGISFLEREHRYREAIIFLRRLLANFSCDRRRGYWTLRLSVDLEHVSCLNESLSVAEDGLSDPWIRAGSRVALQRRVLRLSKPPRRWKIPKFSESINRKIPEVQIQGRPLNCKTGTKSRFYGEDGDQCGVEQLALQYYAGEGNWQGVHTESGIWLTIFALLTWDSIFTDVPDVFRHRFQTCPLDLETDCFYDARKSIIECHLKKIEEGMGEEMIITAWESHVGTACRGVDWDRHSLSELRAVVTCIGGPCLASVCRHLAQDYRSWTSGMPDLLLWRFNGYYSGEAKLVEVKGPRDRLSEQQRAWLLFLMECGISVEVCKVSPSAISA